MAWDICMERGIYVDGPITMLPGSRLPPTDSERHNAAVEIKIIQILEGKEKRNKIKYRIDRCSTIHRTEISNKVFRQLSNVPKDFHTLSLT